MFICPNCKKYLRKAGNRYGDFWSCSSCSGRAVTFEVARDVISPPVVNRLWQQAKSGVYPYKRKCPACNCLMKEVPIYNAEKTEYIDVCPVCHLVWFDANEFENLPKIPFDELPSNNLSPQARESVALAKLEILKQTQEREKIGSSTPDEWWELIPAIFGLPIEYNDTQLKYKPLLTWILSVVIAIVSVAAFFNLEETVRNWGLIPAEFARHYGLTFISSFFLHGGVFHLVGNLYFLLVFGDNVEDVLGKWRYALLIIGALMMGDILHIMANPHSGIPCIGASGGISGIITYYALKFPRAHIGILFRFGFYFRWVRLPASIMLFFWILMQFFITYLQMGGFSDVSALAHLGGAAVGFVFWLIQK